MIRYVHFTTGIHAPIHRAKAGSTQGAPLVLYADEGAYSGVTFFCDDHALAYDLADAINAVIEKHRAKHRPLLTLVEPEPA